MTYLSIVLQYEKTKDQEFLKSVDERLKQLVIIRGTALLFLACADASVTEARTSIQAEIKRMRAEPWLVKEHDSVPPGLLVKCNEILKMKVAKKS